MAPCTMRAWQYNAVSGGLDESMNINPTVPVPPASSLTKDQLLIQVIAAALNPAHYKIPEAGLMGRFMMPHRPATPGIDFCGRVAARHAENGAFGEGDLVFGGLDFCSPHGTLAEYVVAPARNAARLPAGVTREQGAVVGTAATSAYLSLTPRGRPLPPEARVFVNGGSGGVGTWTVQLARAMGADEVVVACCGANAGLCRGLGRDGVVDYRTEDVVARLKARPGMSYFDLLIDNIGGGSALYGARAAILKPGGTFVQVGTSSRITIWATLALVRGMLMPSWAVLGGTPYYMVSMDNAAKILEVTGGWMEEGKVGAVIDQVYGFEDAPAAYTKLKGGM